MIDGLKPYPAYDDSGVHWLGRVPAHWNLLRLKDIASLHGRIGFHGLSASDYRDRGVVLVGGTNFRGWSVDWSSCHRVDEEWYFKDRNIQLRDGDLLITKDGTIGKTAIITALPERAVLNSGVMVIRPRGNDSYLGRYILYCLNSRMFSEFVALRRTGATIHHLYEETFYKFPVLLPSLVEQLGIVRFLDYADYRIRRYVRAKQKFVKLLEEQKQVIIRRAITRGLNANVRLKPSGVEWLGDVPHHWDIVPLKFLSTRIQNGSTPSSGNSRFYEGGTIPWFGPSSLAPYEGIGNPVRHVTKAAVDEGRARLIRGPALLIVVIGATAGRMTILDQDGCTNQQITSYELRTQRVNPGFILRQLRGAQCWLQSTASTATIPILDGGEVSRLLISP